MDYQELTRHVYQKIRKFDPENAFILIDNLLSKDHSKLDMFHLAFCSDHVLQAVVDKVKRDLVPSPHLGSFVSTMPSPSTTSQGTSLFALDPFTMFVPFGSSPRRVSVQTDGGQWMPYSMAYGNSVPGVYGGIPGQPQLEPFDEQFASLNLSSSSFRAQPEIPPLEPDQRALPNPYSSPEFAMQVCENFRKGYCKFGGDCKYLHVVQMPNKSYMILNPSATDVTWRNHYDLPNGSAKQLEMDFIDILKSVGRIPVTIPSLPILYFDKYGKVLHFEDYLIDARAQRNFDGGIIEYLGQMSNAFCVIDRPHSMQSIILKDDIEWYLKFCEERNEHVKSVTSLRQVYLTFPPQSTFTETDLVEYFNIFGPVEEVRIPVQEKRMYGFLTFFYPESVTLILKKTSPHFIRGAQVLVKPYRHKNELVDRRVEEKIEQASSSNIQHPNSSAPQRHKNKEPITIKRKHDPSTGVTSTHNYESSAQASGSTSEINVNLYDNEKSSDSDKIDLPENPFSF